MGTGSHGNLRRLRRLICGRKRVKPGAHLQQHGKRDAETDDQRRSAERHDGKSPFGMLFDIRVHVHLRGKAGFVP
jgi:hypothetical protein